MKMYGITAGVRRFLEIKYRMMKSCWKIEKDDAKLISLILPMRLSVSSFSFIIKLEYGRETVSTECYRKEEIIWGFYRLV